MEMESGRCFKIFAKYGGTRCCYLRRRTERAAPADDDLGALGLRTLVFLVAAFLVLDFLAVVAEPRRPREVRDSEAWVSAGAPSRSAISWPSALAAASASAASRASRAAISSSR